MKKILLLLTISIALMTKSNGQCPDGRFLNKTFAVDTIKDIQYGSNTRASGVGTENLLMDIYVPRADTMAHRPMIIFAHGGSFIGGDRRTSDMILICNELAERGYVTASIEYRLESPSSIGNTQKMVTEVIRSQQDGKAAVRFFRKDAATLDAYKVDTTQIFFGGTSAGGILALHLAYMNDSDPLPANWVTWANGIGGIEGTSGNPGHSSDVKAIVTFAGGIGDTNWMNPGNVPWIDFHSVNDATVPDGTGYPLGIPTLPLISGGRDMNLRAIHNNQNHQYFQFPGTAHPPFADGVSATWDTIENRTARFLYNNLECNPDKYVGISNTPNDQLLVQVSIFPNPVSNVIQLDMPVTSSSYQINISNSVGSTVYTSKTLDGEHQEIDLSAIQSGMYFVTIEFTNKKYANRSIKIIVE